MKIEKNRECERTSISDKQDGICEQKITGKQDRTKERKVNMYVEIP